MAQNPQPLWKYLAVEKESSRSSISQKTNKKSLDLMVSKIPPIIKTSSDKANAEHLYNMFNDAQPSISKQSNLKTIQRIQRSNFKLEQDQQNSSVIYAERICNSSSSSVPLILMDPQNLSKTKSRYSSIIELLCYLKQYNQSIKMTLFQGKYNLYETIMEINDHVQTLTHKASTLEVELQKKQIEIKNLTDDIKNIQMIKMREMQKKITILQGENDTLHEKIFDAQQRVAQVDLQIQQRLRSLSKGKQQYLSQIKRLQQEIEELSSQLLHHNLLEKQIQLQLKEQEIRKKQSQIEEQFQEITRQHASMQEQLKRRQAQLQNRYQQLFKIQTFDRLNSPRSHRRSSVEKSSREVNFYGRNNGRYQPFTSRERKVSRVEKIDLQLKRLQEQVRFQMKQFI